MASGSFVLMSSANDLRRCSVRPVHACDAIHTAASDQAIQFFAENSIATPIQHQTPACVRRQQMVRGRAGDEDEAAPMARVRKQSITSSRAKVGGKIVAGMAENMARIGIN
jgi:hypothetical protein